MEGLYSSNLNTFSLKSLIDILLLVTVCNKDRAFVEDVDMSKSNAIFLYHFNDRRGGFA